MFVSVCKGVRTRYILDRICSVDSPANGPQGLTRKRKLWKLSPYQHYGMYRKTPLLARHREQRPYITGA